MIACAIVMAGMIALGFFRGLKSKQFGNVISVASFSLNDIGFIAFVIFFMLAAYMNVGKRFLSWDEFSHWGTFLKETLRIDGLFYFSEKTISHKDYTSAITLFEALWCRLSRRFLEADAYRAIQIFQFSMIFPMISRDGKSKVFTRDAVSDKKYKFKLNGEELGISMLKFMVFILIPTLVCTSNGQYIYHSIYKDLPFAFLIFYSVWQIISCDKASDKSRRYSTFVLALTLTVMALTKTVAIIFIPMIIAYYFVSCLCAQQNTDWRKALKKIFAESFVAACVPVAIWYVINKFIKIYVPPTGGIQTLGGVKLSNLYHLLLGERIAGYQDAVNEIYWESILTRPVYGKLSYAFALLAVVIALLVLAYSRKEKAEKNRLLLLDLWVAVVGIIYMLLVWYLYLTAFSEREAISIASYERYINSFLLAAILLLITILFHQRDLITKRTMSIGVVAFLLCMIWQHPDAINQLKPGVLMTDEDTYRTYQPYVTAINSETEATPDTSVLCITCGDNGGISARLAFYCNPRIISWISPGTSRDGSDWYSSNITVEEFVERVASYDYLYLAKIDDIFKENYADAFNDFEDIQQYDIFKVKIENGKISRDTGDTEENEDPYQELRDTIEAEEYFDQLAALKNVTIYFSVRDCAGTRWTASMIEAMHQMGFSEDIDTLFAGGYRSFIGISDNGNAVYESLKGDEANYYDGEYNGHEIFIASKTLNRGNEASIIIDDDEYSVDWRGINIVVADDEAGEVIDAVTFDTWQEGMPCYR